MYQDPSTFSTLIFIKYASYASIHASGSAGMLKKKHTCPSTNEHKGKVTERIRRPR